MKSHSFHHRFVFLFLHSHPFQHETELVVIAVCWQYAEVASTMVRFCLPNTTPLLVRSVQAVSASSSISYCSLVLRNSVATVASKFYCLSLAFYVAKAAAVNTCQQNRFNITKTNSPTYSHHCTSVTAGASPFL